MPTAPPVELAVVREQGGAPLLQLVAAWDQLAPRLPPQAGGHTADVILAALKVAVAYAPPPPAAIAAASSSSSSSEAQQPPGDSQQQPWQQQQQQQQQTLSAPVARALSLASRLADLAAAGLPIDAESIAAGILAEVLLAQPAAPSPSSSGGSSSSGGGGGEGGLTLAVVEERLGPIVAQLVHDVQRARALPARVELLDDTAAAALRELCLAFYDVRATAVEVVSRLDILCRCGPGRGRRARV